MSHQLLTEAPPVAAPQSRRVVFVDLARSVAAIFMLYGHAMDALLAPEYRTGSWHDLWQFQRGLTSYLFLLLSGFAFSIATARHWQSQLTWSPVLIRRARRFGLFLLLGYVLHVPVVPISELAAAPDGVWRQFVAVDVLRLIGVTFFGVQLLVMLVRRRRAVLVATLLLTAVIPVVTPAVWSVDWTAALPTALAAYLSPATGSTFVVFPWSAFVLLGVGLGQLYAVWGIERLTTYATRVLLLPGIGLVVAWAGLRVGTSGLVGSGPHAAVPLEVLLRAGVCLLIVALVAFVSRSIGRLPHVLSAFAQETLIVYVVHLSLVYGSIWSPGLVRLFGPTLTPGPMIAVVAGLIAAMMALAGVWNRWKHMHPRQVRTLSFALGALVALRLLLPQ